MLPSRHAACSRPWQHRVQEFEPVFSKFYPQIKKEKNILKSFSQKIQSYLKLNLEYREDLTNLISEVDQSIQTENNPFHFFSNFKIILNLQNYYLNNFFEQIEKYMEHLKKAIDLNLKNVSNFLSNMYDLEEKINLKTEFIKQQNSLILISFQEIENVIAEDYFKDTYKLNINKNKQIINNKEQLIDECQKNEKDFFTLENEIKNLIKKYIEEYNSRIKEFKMKFIELYNLSKEDFLNIIEIIKGNGGNELINIQEEEIQKFQNFDINKPEFQEILSNYLNYQTKEEDLSKTLKIKKYKFPIKDKIDTSLNNLYNIKPNKNKHNSLITSKDIYYIIEQMQNYNFQLIDKTSYNLDLERNKISISENFRKLFGYDFSKRTKLGIETFSKEEENKFIDDLFINENYITYFLHLFNLYRTIGDLELIQVQFEICSKIFCKASDFLLEHNNRNIYYPLIILSQTFYKKIKGEKYYLQNEIREKEIFTQEKFWIDFIESTINEDLNVFENQTKTYPLTEENKNLKKLEIISNKLISVILCLKEFKLGKDLVNGILNPIMDKYNINENKRNEIFSKFDSLKNKLK